MNPAQRVPEVYKSDPDLVDAIASTVDQGPARTLSMSQWKAITPDYRHVSEDGSKWVLVLHDGVTVLEKVCITDEVRG